MCEKLKGGPAAALFDSLDEVFCDAAFYVKQLVVVALVRPRDVADEGFDVVDAAQESPAFAFDLPALDLGVQGVVQIRSDGEGALQAAGGAVDPALGCSSPFPVVGNPRLSLLLPMFVRVIADHG